MINTRHEPPTLRVRARRISAIQAARPDRPVAARPGERARPRSVHAPEKQTMCECTGYRLSVASGYELSRLGDTEYVVNKSEGLWISHW
jgi:hypothetical protein